jgi:uncharacterized protein (TIGR03435 family)
MAHARPARSSTGTGPSNSPSGFATNRNRGGAVIVGSGTMPQLTKMLSGSAGGPVVDKTGMDSRYNYVLTLTPNSAQSNIPSNSAPLDLFTAVEQLRRRHGCPSA